MGGIKNAGFENGFQSASTSIALIKTFSAVIELKLYPNTHLG